MDQVPAGIADARRRAVAAGHRGDEAGARALVAHDDPTVRVAAVGALARLGRLGPAEVAAALADPDARVRRRACAEVGRRPLGATPASWATTLLVATLDDGDDGVVEAACWALGEGGDEDAVVALGRLAAGHRAPLCREAAVAALGAIGAAQGLAAVLGALDDKPAVRRRAAVALAAFDDPAADEGLRRCLDDRDWQVRQIAEELTGSEGPSRR